VARVFDLKDRAEEKGDPETDLRISAKKNRPFSTVGFFLSGYGFTGKEGKAVKQKRWSHFLGKNNQRPGKNIRLCTRARERSTNDLKGSKKKKSEKEKGERHYRGGSEWS